MSSWNDWRDAIIHPFIPQVTNGVDAATPDVPDPSEELRRQEAERQARIQAGMGRINDTFGQFNDGYYQGVEKAYLDYYNPQLEDKFKNANRQVRLGLASTGNLNSTAGARTIADLIREYTTQRGQVSSGATGAANETRSNVERNRGELVNQLNAGAGIDTVANSAAERARSLSTPPAYSPLGDIFAQFTGNVLNGINARRAGYGAPTGGGTSTYSNPSSSVRTVY